MRFASKLCIHGEGYLQGFIITVVESVYLRLMKHFLLYIIGFLEINNNEELKMDISEYHKLK